MAKLERVIYRPDYNPDSPNLEMVFDAGDDKHFAVFVALNEQASHENIARQLRHAAYEIEAREKQASKLKY